MQRNTYNLFVISSIAVALTIVSDTRLAGTDPAFPPMTSQQESRKPNRLLREKSPYLLQHAYNPVDWYPWGEEAFARARAENKPIFLSIGYSTCHWCHVMERESFENDSIAAIINEFFVPIKVDREERPDIDRVYMSALQGMGQNGGWPMSMFLTPGLRPFYGGTYFPPDSRYGRAGFPDVLRRIHDIWTREHDKAEESARGIFSFLEDIAKRGGPLERVSDSVATLCFDQISATYDAVRGGFGGGPKFPRPVVFNFLLRHYQASGNPAALTMVTHTLRAMAAGGMYDQIGGGFHRYSVDADWRVPHFEKMLYDQAQLVQAYLDAFLLTGEAGFATIARETLDYVLRDMTVDGGGFTSAEDADSPLPDNPKESGEGAFYVWTRAEIAAILGADADSFCDQYGVEPGGNVGVDPQQEFIGKNILYQARPVDAGARRGGARHLLFEARTKRPRPLRDDKVLTSWNGMMIGAFARAWRILGEERYGVAAHRGADFVLAHLYDGHTGLLHRRFRAGDAGLEAHLDDYAFLVAGLLDLYEASGEGRWLSSAMNLTGKQISLFHDPGRAGFFDTSGSDSTVLVRLREQYDGAEPSGNSIAATNLIRLSRMAERPDWDTLATGTIAVGAAFLNSQPVAVPQLAAALEFQRTPPQQIVIAGPIGDPAVEALIRVAYASYHPTMVLLRSDCGKEGEALEKANPFVKNLRMVAGKAAAYVCRNFTCEIPATDPALLAAQLTPQTAPR